MSRLPELTPKQKLMIEFGLKHRYCILGARMRLGKSRAAIEIARKAGGNNLIVCPAYLIPNWVKEIRKWWPSADVTPFTKGNKIYEVCDTDFVVISYDLVQKAEHLFEWADNVISDETHNLKSMSAKRTQFFHKALYENSCKRFLSLTGTPIKNRIKEFYSLIALTYYDPKLKDQSFLEKYPDEITFAEQFSVPQSYNVVTRGRIITVTNYYGIRNKSELKKWLKGRYLKIEADANDLPPVSYLDTLVSDIDDTELLEAFNSYFDDSSDDSRSKRTGSVLPEHKRNAAVKKVPFTIKYVEDLLETVDCCLVYSDHVPSCEMIAKHFKVPPVTGSMPSSQRASMITDFQAGKLNILCATIGALKEGADLYRAKDLVINDPSWVPGDIEQVVNRMRVLGDKEPRTVHRIMGSPQDERIWDVIESKIRTISQIA